MPIQIIAEAGVNHDGKLAKALDLADAAKRAGADAVKYQTFIPELAIAPGSKDFNRLSKLALDFASTLKLARHCEAIDIEFMSTPDDIDSLHFLVNECGVKRLKIGSGSLLYGPLIYEARASNLPVLLSTGMATIEEIRRTLSYTYWQNLTLMHCVSLYPCPHDRANVGAMRELRFFGFPVGYSDHTLGPHAAMAAAALGATVIEKHFTIRRDDGGPDHSMSMGPSEFSMFVRAIRVIEVVMGTGVKAPSQQEAAMIPTLRKNALGLQAGI